jgi:uncharacterized phage protein (TIGR02218 family)
MTLYDTMEQSVHDGSPIEAYRFVGSFNTYRYTSGDEAIMVNGEEYTPKAITRRAVKLGTQADDRLEIEVELPVDDLLVAEYAFANSPQKLTLEVFRVHRGTDFNLEAALLWKGEVTSFSVAGRLARLLVPSIFGRILQGTVPSVFYQAMCNNVLYDARCRADTLAFSSTSTVTGIDDVSITVVDDGAPDGDQKAGEIVCPRNGERRMIMNNQGNLLTISFPFLNLLVGDTVIMYQGCDHLFSTCADKFSNAVNFGGHPFIPTDNPFTVTRLL